MAKKDSNKPKKTNKTKTTRTVIEDIESVFVNRKENLTLQSVLEIQELVLKKYIDDHRRKKKRINLVTPRLES